MDMNDDRKRGWHPDPEGGPKQRYWDGKQWHKNAPSARLARQAAWWAAQQRDDEEADRVVVDLDKDDRGDN